MLGKYGVDYEALQIVPMTREQKNLLKSALFLFNKKNKTKVRMPEYRVKLMVKGALEELGIKEVTDDKDSV